MDPISGKPNLPPPSIDSTGGTSPVSGKTPFPIDSLQGAAAPDAAVKVGSASPVLESMRKTISGDRSAALESVVNKRLEAQFGNAVTPQMKQFALESIKNDPHFSAVFNKLYSEISASRSND
jgi:hypothetical protein